MNLRQEIKISLGQYLWHVMWMVMGIGLTTYKTIDYFRVDRPLALCMARKDPVCHVEGKDLYIKYAENGDYMMSKKEVR